MHSSRSHRKRRNAPPVLRLPSKREVSHFREKRLLIHLHEQLVEQVDENPTDWQLQFQLANLLAFSDDYSYYKNKDIDIFKAEEHYQKSLTLLQQIHEQNYALYQMQRNLNSPASPSFTMNNDEYTGSLLFTGCKEQKFNQQTANISITNELNEPISSPYNSGNETDDSCNGSNQCIVKIKRTKQRNKNRPKKMDNNDISNQIKQRRKNVSLIKEHNNYNNNHNINGMIFIQYNIAETLKEKHNKSIKKKKKRQKPKKQLKIKKRSLTIKVHNDNNQVSKQIKCNYSSVMSQEELQREQEKMGKLNKETSTELQINTAAAKYLHAVRSSYEVQTSTKRPSIIAMLTAHESPISPCNLSPTPHSPLSLIQSESETATLDTEYIVPDDILKGYTECFFGYGKYLYHNRRIKESVHNLLECAKWYNDSFVDPSCLTSLVLPPQFLFQDAVKKRHCINFRTLTKFISKILNDEQKSLDKQFKQINIMKYIEEYDNYLQIYQQEQIHIPGQREQQEPETALFENNSNGSNSSLMELTHRLSNVGNNLNNLRLEARLSINSNISIDTESQSPSADYSAMTLDNKHKKNLINYGVYPQNVQDLVAEYIHLCSSYHRLGILLTDFYRYVDAKKEYNRALGIFRKLKIKPSLYDDILSEIRLIQRNSFNSPSGKERAQNLAKRHKASPSSKTARSGPQTPSFEFSFCNDNHSRHSYPSYNSIQLNK